MCRFANGRGLPHQRDPAEPSRDPKIDGILRPDLQLLHQRRENERSMFLSSNLHQQVRAHSHYGGGRICPHLVYRQFLATVSHLPAISSKL